jgi:hypothetical protein
MPASRLYGSSDWYAALRETSKNRDETAKSLRIYLSSKALSSQFSLSSQPLQFRRLSRASLCCNDMPIYAFARKDYRCKLLGSTRMLKWFACCNVSKAATIHSSAPFLQSRVTLFEFISVHKMQMFLRERNETRATNFCHRLLQKLSSVYFILCPHVPGP